MYILEYIKTVDENGNRIGVLEGAEYSRYGNMEYSDYESANEDRIALMWGSDNIYTRVKEIPNDR